MNAAKLRQQKLVNEARLALLTEVRATVRADILLDPQMTAPQMLDRITKTIDNMIAKEQA